MFQIKFILLGFVCYRMFEISFKMRIYVDKRSKVIILNDNKYYNMVKIIHDILTYLLYNISKTIVIGWRFCVI